MKKRYLFFIIVLLFSFSAKTQEKDTISASSYQAGIEEYREEIIRSAPLNGEYRIKAAILVGGVTPLPVPLEIQKRIL
jgi:hypothetical protein